MELFWTIELLNPCTIYLPPPPTKQKSRDNEKELFKVFNYLVNETKDLKLQWSEPNLLSFRSSSVLKTVHLVTFLKLKNFWDSFRDFEENC